MDGVVYSLPESNKEDPCLKSTCEIDYRIISDDFVISRKLVFHVEGRIQILFVNRVLKRIFGLQRDEIERLWSNLH